MRHVFHELLELNGNLGHWLFEAEGGLIALVWHMAWQKKHDRLHHGGGRGDE